MLVAVEKLNSVAEALVKKKCWKRAMEAEMKAVEDNKTWVVTISLLYAQRKSPVISSSTLCKSKSVLTNKNCSTLLSTELPE